MVNQYKRGRAGEHYIKHKLEALGYFVFRMASSKPIDLIAIKDGKAIMIEVKKSEHWNKKDVEEERQLAKRAGCDFALYYKANGRYVKEQWNIMS